MSTRRILVLGGTGFVGRQVCEQLARLGWQVTVPTRRAVNAAAIQNLPGLTVVEASVHSASDLTRLMPGHDAVVNALPYHLATLAATQARDAGCHYFDLTEDVATTQLVKSLAADATHALIPQCGLAPGFIATDMTRATADRVGVPWEDFLAHSAKEIPVARVGHPEDVAAALWDAMEDDRFLVLPHPEVAQYYAGRATGTDRWLAQMNGLQTQLGVPRLGG